MDLFYYVLDVCTCCLAFRTAGKSRGITGASGATAGLIQSLAYGLRGQPGERGAVKAFKAIRDKLVSVILLKDENCIYNLMSTRLKNMNKNRMGDALLYKKY